MNAQVPIPKKSLGQHFLVDAAICRRIVDLLETTSDEQVLEIGPGPGALTRELQNKNLSRLLLLEKDTYWADRWMQMGYEVVAGDAMDFPWEELGAAGMWKLAGNLPYNVASPLIWDIVSRCRCWRKAVFMTQKEVAQRICALPGTSHYGALSVWVQCHAIPTLEFSLKPGAFRPPPKVDSAVMTFLPVSSAPPEPQALNLVLKACFRQRRKQLGNVLRPYPLLLTALEAEGIGARQRAEELSPGQFLRLGGAWAAGQQRN